MRLKMVLRFCFRPGSNLRYPATVPTTSGFSFAAPKVMVLVGQMVRPLFSSRSDFPSLLLSIVSGNTVNPISLLWTSSLEQLSYMISKPTNANDFAYSVSNLVITEYFDDPSQIHTDLEIHTVNILAILYPNR